MNWLASNVHAMSYGQIWRPQRFIDDKTTFPALKSKGEQNAREQYAYIETLLADGREWAVPGAYSVVDPYLLVFYYWGQRIGLDMHSAYPAWTRLSAHIVARPAVLRALAKEQIKIF
jgi:glutathione S-transferase